MPKPSSTKLARMAGMQAGVRGRNRVELLAWMEARGLQPISLLLRQDRQGERGVVEPMGLHPNACDPILALRHGRICRCGKDQCQSEIRSCVGPNRVRAGCDRSAGRSRRHSGRDRSDDRDGCAKWDGEMRKESGNDVELARVHGFCTRTRVHAYWCEIGDGTRQSGDSRHAPRSRTSWHAKKKRD